MAIFDYTNTDAFISEKSPPQTQKFLELGKKIGEPMITGFNPSTLAEDLDSSWFHLYDNLNPEDIERLHFKGRTDRFYSQEMDILRVWL
jgi:hypothetical protein